MTDPVFTKVTDEEKDALLYTAVFNEVNRLNETMNKEERQRIRQFILEGYRELKKSLRL